jgi:nucleotide-binding universal stress UspA family protein
MFGTILLAVDGSSYSRRATEFARRLAAGGDKVVVLHVTEIMPIHGGTTVDLDLDREGLAAARRFGGELEQAGVPTKVELIRAFAGHVVNARPGPVGGRDGPAGWRPIRAAAGGPTSGRACRPR